jgi:hypothetical protein
MDRLFPVPRGKSTDRQVDMIAIFGLGMLAGVILFASVGALRGISEGWYEQ